MSGTSSTSTVIAIRLPNEVVELIRKRCEARGYTQIADYLRPRIIESITRKHRRNDASERGSERLQDMPVVTRVSPIIVTTVANP